MKALNNILGGLRIVVICCFVLSFICSCQDNTLSQVSHENVSSSLRKENNNQRREIDWALVAIADGGGASLGSILGSLSGNIYVKIALAAGVGAYASIAEYDRQKAEMENQDAIYYPDVINDFHPLHPEPLVLDSAYKLNHMYGDVGEAHNLLVQMKYELMPADSLISEEGLFFNLLSWSFDQQNVNIQNYSLDIEDMLASVQTQQDNHWNNKKEDVQILFPNFWNDFTKYPIEETRDYINNIVNLCNSPLLDSTLVQISVAYYSKCLWNTMAPNPTVAQECVVWSPHTGELQYVSGRTNVVDIIENREDELIFYPAFDQTGIIALYLYTDTNQYGASEYVDSFTIESNFHSESIYYNGVSIDISSGMYMIEPTVCNNVYVVPLSSN